MMVFRMQQRSPHTWLRPIPIWSIVYLLYAIVKNEYGSSEMGREIAYIFSKIKRNQMESLIDISQTPPIHTTGWMLKRVEEMVDQTAAVIRATQLGF